MMSRLYLLPFILIIFIASCGNNQEATRDSDYEQTKNMVVDILRTDEGKKALQEIISDDKMKQHLIIESDVVKEAITEALVSEQGAEMWKKLFEDPSFVESFNKSIAEEQQKLFKHLMNDSEFQKQMLELMQNPEIANQTLSLLKSQQFRAHLEETIQQTIENPIYQAKIQEILLKAAEKQQQSEGGGESGGKGGEGGSESGGEAGGEEGGGS